MTRIKERAVEMIRRMPDDEMLYVINILQNLEEMTAKKETDIEQAMMAFQDLMKYRGRLPADFDAEKEMAEAREGKYGNNCDKKPGRFCSIESKSDSAG